MRQPWELHDPVPEHPSDRGRRRRKQAATTVVALLVVVGMIGTSVVALF
ncbi:MAG TPA: hypothetical protein H9884_11105 [Candidatus Yaniella excrementigallinarum]|nr:hypothetical protein [Candidatus Yaniella excrementigallinarum]